LDDLLIAVLVNDRTSGEAEAVAVALQDADRAFVVGTPTVGEGSSYDFVELSDGSALYIPISRWYPASGRWLGGSGIKPDMLVFFEEEEQGYGGESQFNRAYEYLDGQLPPFR
jgi:carboxyl-terminal processing protease